MDAITHSFRIPLIGGDLKRAFDLLLATIALVLLAPLMASIYLLIIILDGRPAIIRHMRLGASGKLFPCLKFRTMVVDAPSVLAEYLERNPAAKLEWEQTQKLRNDPRITKVGFVLRRTSLDELPQLFNVIAGHMSLIGPRPITPEEARRYGTAVFSYIHARPGITGLWQVSGRNKVPYPQRVRLDEEYIATWSFWKDIHILVRTVRCVLTGEGCS